jgi:uncharacterized protein (DUF1015 family)
MFQTLTKPFKGTLYNKDKIQDIALCVCPPYDVITNSEPYYERNSLNAIRLELPEATPSLDKYNAARATMEEWMKNGILQQESKDTIYVYEQEFAVDDTSFLRRGILSRLNLPLVEKSEGLRKTWLLVIVEPSAMATALSST